MHEGAWVQATLTDDSRPVQAMDFEDLKKAVGFPEYYAEEARYGRRS